MKSRWYALRLCCWLGLWMMAAGGTGWQTPPFTGSASAQEVPPPGAPAGGAGAVSTDGRPFDVAADVVDNRQPERFLAWMIRVSGLVGFLIMLVAFVMVALVMMLFLQLRRDNYVPADFLAEFESKLNSRDYHGAYELAKSDDSFVARKLASGLARLPRGYDQVERGMAEVGEDEALSMEHKIGYLALIASIAPLLGLLGTMQGMLLSFHAIATSSREVEPYKLADGIGLSLFTTLEGLLVAIPAIVAYTVYRNRLSRFLFEGAVVADGLMGRFSGVKPQTVSIGPATAAPAVASGPQV